MITTAVILAAGKGTRLRENDLAEPKPLQRVLGASLLLRTLRSLRSGGIDRAVIVVGFRSEAIQAELDTDRDIAALGLEIVCAPNTEYERSNGVSVLAARDFVPEHFVLSMSDHVYDPRVAELAVHADLSDCDLQLAVDRRVDEVFDIPDATKVRAEGAHIVEIGKELVDYNCIDCGVFAVSTGLLDALAEVYSRRGDCSLSDGVRALAGRRRARVFDIGDSFWQDVDTPEALGRAEHELRVRGR